MDSMEKYLVEANEDRFRAHVDADIRGMERADISAALRSAACIDRWLRTLVSMKRNSELQVTLDRADRSEQRLVFERHPDGRHLWLKYVADRDRWAAGNARFKAGVEDKIDEAKSILNQHRSRRLTKLEEAIATHRNVMQDNPSVADEDLWRVLDEQ